jgi:magnesium transporter
MNDLKDVDLQRLIQERRLSELRELISDLPIPDIAELLLEINKPDRVLIFRLLPRRISSEVFSYLTAENRNALLRELIWLPYYRDNAGLVYRIRFVI